jgi:transcription elongation factor Elf1
MATINPCEGIDMSAMIICGECGGKMRLITRSANSSTPVNNVEYLFVNYATCFTCGSSAQVQTTVKFIRKPLVQVDLFETA